MQQFILIVTATSIGLIAGLFYGYSCSVNNGLGKLSDEGYLTAMQSINREILNTVFFSSFIGTLLLLPISTWFEYKSGISGTFYLLLAATLLYAIGAFGVTMLGNVPLNEALNKFNIPAATADQLAKQRAMFEGTWNRLHSIRTFASVASFILTIIACIKHKPV